VTYNDWLIVNRWGEANTEGNQPNVIAERSPIAINF
jgi:hypothetical protein